MWCGTFCLQIWDINCKLYYATMYSFLLSHNYLSNCNNTRKLPHSETNKDTLSNHCPVLFICVDSNMENYIYSLWLTLLVCRLFLEQPLAPFYRISGIFIAVFLMNTFIPLFLFSLNWSQCLFYEFLFFSCLTTNKPGLIKYCLYFLI